MKQIPATTNAKCEAYQSQAYACNCFDARNKGGSYIDPIDGDQVCKHMFHMRNEWNPRRISKPKSIYTDAQRVWLSNCKPVLPLCKEELFARLKA